MAFLPVAIARTVSTSKLGAGEEGDTDFFRSPALWAAASLIIRRWILTIGTFIWFESRHAPSPLYLWIPPPRVTARKLSHPFSQGSSRIPTDNFLCHLSLTPKPSFQTNCLLQFLPTRRTWLTDNLSCPPRSPQILPEMSFRKMSKI